MEKQIQLTPNQTITETLLADVVAVFAEWEYNWLSSDFEQAFKGSQVGWKWLWDKFKECDHNTFQFYACLDITHQKMLVRFIFEEKYKDLIINREANRVIFGNLSDEDPENEE